MATHPTLPRCPCCSEPRAFPRPDNMKTRGNKTSSSQQILVQFGHSVDSGCWVFFFSPLGHLSEKPVTVWEFLFCQCRIHQILAEYNSQKDEPCVFAHTGSATNDQTKSSLYGSHVRVQHTYQQTKSQRDRGAVSHCRRENSLKVVAEGVLTA